MLVVGLGKREELDAERLAVAAALAAKEAGRLEATSLAWLLPESERRRRDSPRAWSPARSSAPTASTAS